MAKTQESVLNSALAQCLRTKHPRWRENGMISAEQTGVLAESAGLRPDIIVHHPNGLPVAVETELAPAHTVEEDAQARLDKKLQKDGGVIEQSIAVRLPEQLAQGSQNKLPQAIAAARFEYCVYSGTPDEPVRWPQAGWVAGDVNDLANCIELASLSENRAARGVRILENGVGQAAAFLRNACVDAPDTLAAIARELHQEDGEQTSRMAMAIVANAMTFHTAIAGAHGIPPLDQLRGELGMLLKGKVLKIWRYILKEINYWPIFRIASDILLPMRNGTAQKILERLAAVAGELDALGATSQHDLCGRMFQRLITDRKFLATFYTLPSSAALLAELAIARLDVDWSDGEAVTSLRVGDFACGTGALLNAAYAAMMGRYRRRGGDDEALHPRMMERVLVGADIMPAATHLTATVLSSRHPGIPFKNTSVITLPYGEQTQESGRPLALGALDLIEDERAFPLFGTGRGRVRGTAGGGEYVGVEDLPHESFDLVIMNPPFTRPTNHARTDMPVPSFAGLATDADTQKAMSKLLKKINRPGMAGNGHAGLASNFIDIAHAKLRRGGVLALVLPAVFTQGQSWENARALLKKHYRDILVVSITAAGATARAFSADTGMAEVLVVATRKDDDGTESKPGTFANIYTRSKTILEAMMLAGAVQDVAVAYAATPGGVEDNLDYAASTPLHISSEAKRGYCTPGTLDEASKAGVQETDVAPVANGIMKGELRFPRQSEPLPIPVCPLQELGQRGLLCRNINGKGNAKQGESHGPFDIEPIAAGGAPTWPVLWGHDAQRETRLVVKPDSRGAVRPGSDERAKDAWQKTASRLHFSRDFRLNSQPLAACITPDPCIGGRAWPNFICAQEEWEEALVLWANSTPGLISFWWHGTRQQLGRTTITLSRLPDLMVLDPRQLSARQLKKTQALFEQFKERTLLPANEAWRDETRQDLDRALLVDLLGLPEETMEALDLLRRQWCAEPSVRGGKPPPHDKG